MKVHSRANGEGRVSMSRRKRLTLFAYSLLFLCGAALSAPPAITNLRAQQRAGTKWVDIHFDASTDYPPLTIALQVSADGGATYGVPVVHVTGDVGPNIQPGTGKHIVWDAGADWNEQQSAAMRFFVRAEDALSIPDFALIPAGTFQMGNTFSPEYYPDSAVRGAYRTDEITSARNEVPVHSVWVSGFVMQTTEVTKAQWDEVDQWAKQNGYDFFYDENGASPDTAPFAGGFNHPVANVSWIDAMLWCNAKSEKEGKQPCYEASAGYSHRSYARSLAPVCKFANNGYRLPTEAEWEKAARGGLAGKRFPRGDTLGRADANFSSEWSVMGTDPVSGESIYQTFPYWPPDVCPERGPHPVYLGLNLMAPGGPFATSPVKSFPANGYGLYDMDGNVVEHCWDFYQPGYYAVSPAVDPAGPSSSSPSGYDRVARGGCWSASVFFCRTSYRWPYPGPFATGFRIVRRP